MVKKILNKIQTLILLILAAGAPVVAVVPEQYWFEKRVGLAASAVVLLTLLVARFWVEGGIKGLKGIKTTENLGWVALGVALLVATTVPAGRIANLMAPELWVGLGAVVAYFAIKSILTSSKQVKLGFVAVLVGLVAAAALGAAGGISPIGPIRPMARGTLEILRRSPVWGEFREFRVGRVINASAFKRDSSRLSAEGGYHVMGILQIASGLGILGILGTLALIYQLGLKSVKGILKSGSLWWRLLNILVLVLLVGFLVLPHPALMLWPLVVVAALAQGISQIGPISPIGPMRRAAWAALVGLLVIAVLGSSFGLGKVVWGELKFREALAAANRNEGITTYYALLEAVKRNPYEVRYRLLASQIDIALANSIATSAAEEKSEALFPSEPRSGESAATPSARVTAQDRNNILILIQQAVVEGKAAIKLDPENSLLWQNLASIYRGLMGVASGAEDWALKSYQRAAELTPSDPNSWIGIGEIHFFSGNFQGAVEAFLEATRTSPDLARAHYNLAVAYNVLGEPDRAIEALERVLEILPEDSEDREQVEKDLAFLKEPGSDDSGLSSPPSELSPREPGSETEELKEATTGAEVQPPPPPVGPPEADSPEEASESAEPEELEGL